MNDAAILRVDGAVERPLSLSYADLRALPEAEQVLDVSRFHPSRKGDGVTLESLLRRAEPKPEANYLTLHAARDDFHVSIPLAAVRGEGVVVFRLGEEPLDASRGASALASAVPGLPASWLPASGPAAKSTVSSLILVRLASFSATSPNGRNADSAVHLSCTPRR